MRIGVISDTHGYLDPKIAALFDGVEHILHAGDVGPQHILNELEQIAPVTAVLGNTDSFLTLHDTAVVTLGDRKILLQHIVNPQLPAEALCERLQREGAHAVVFGHTHQPYCETLRGTLFLNPGYAGKQRFRLRRTLALLAADAGGFKVEFKEL